jgi:hypothetical protein
VPLNAGLRLSLNQEHPPPYHTHTLLTLHTRLSPLTLTLRDKLLSGRLKIRGLSMGFCDRFEAVMQVNMGCVVLL